MAAMWFSYTHTLTQTRICDGVFPIDQMHRSYQTFCPSNSTLAVS